MRLYGPVGARNFPADRNPTTIAVGTGRLSVAGGGSSNSGVYVAPAGRRAVLNYDGEQTVTAALAAGQNANLTIAFTPSGGAQTTVADGGLPGASAIGVLRRQSGTVRRNPGDRG